MPPCALKHFDKETLGGGVALSELVNAAGYIAGILVSNQSGISAWRYNTSVSGSGYFQTCTQHAG